MLASGSCKLCSSIFTSPRLHLRVCTHTASSNTHPCIGDFCVVFPGARVIEDVQYFDLLKALNGCFKMAPGSLPNIKVTPRNVTQHYHFFVQVGYQSINGTYIDYIVYIALYSFCMFIFPGRQRLWELRTSNKTHLLFNQPQLIEPRQSEMSQDPDIMDSPPQMNSPCYR